MRDDRLRVMLLVRNLNIGGAQEVVRTLAGQFHKAGVKLVVCSFRDGLLRADIEHLGVPVEILSENRYSVVAFPFFLADMVRVRRALLAVVEKYNINVIHTHLLRSLDFLTLTLRFGRKLLVFWTVHDVRFTLREEHLSRFKWLLGLKQWGYRALYRMGYHWVNGFIAVAEDVHKAVVAYLGGLNEKVTLIINSVDIQRYQTPVDRERIRHELGLSDSAHVMALVATFKTQKGHCYLIDAMPAVVERFPDAHVLFIGDGDLRDELKAQVRSLHLEDHVHFLGLRSDVSNLLGACDYFVLPSLWEGMSMALIEAMARGLPVIATNVSGTNEVVVDGESGILVQPGNVPQLAEAMIHVLSMPVQAQAMGEAGRNRVTLHFSAEKQAEDHLALFRKELNTL